MKDLLIFILIVGAAFGVWTLFTSNKSDPKERLSDAAEAAAGGAIGTAGCLVSLVLQVLPLIAGLVVLGLIVKSCSS